MKLPSRKRGLSRIAAVSFGGPRSGSLFFTTMAFGLLVLSFASPGNLRILRTGAADMFAPLLAAVNYPVEQAAAYVTAVTGIAALQAENETLRQENLKLREWYHAALQLKTDNEALQKLLNVRMEEQNTFITARVVADSGNAFVRSVLVMAGTEDGVDGTHAVLAGDGLIGRIIESGRKTARILLLTDINARVPVLVGLGEGQRAVMAGNNSDLLDLIHLPPDASVKTGDRVVTSGHGGLYPYGLPVGIVTVSGEGATKKFHVEPYADIDRITYVRVVKRTDDPNLLPAPAEGVK